VGSLEIRLPETQIDDETLHGIFSLLHGELPAKFEQNSGHQNVILYSINIIVLILIYNSESQPHAPVYRLSSSFTPYIDRIIALNLRNNNITDLSCQPLSQVVEQSFSLRSLDLRGNHISNKGSAILFECVKKNPSILFVTQRQGGFMIEGHREITTNASNSADQGPQASEEPKHALRIGIRLSSSTPSCLYFEDILLL